MAGYVYSTVNPTWAIADNSADVTQNVVVPIAAVDGQNINLLGCLCGYDADPSSDAYLTIAFTNKTVAKTLKIPIQHKGEHSPPEAALVIGDVGTAVTVTLTGNVGASNIGYLNVPYAVL